MFTLSKKMVVLFVIASLVIVPFGATAFAQDVFEDEDMSAGKMAVDAIVIRPFGIVATVTTSVFFIISLPFSALGGNTKAAYEKLVVDPARFTFMRKLGDF